ncbi:hypothetical protein BOO69_00755 [Sulfitobacter alexandrii]|uniref:Uncharacterized protein n=1 Tax=Sulfitobacter alexandrii TaxID=1917485 RepID=A0A1J0WCR2_9RHOB|nr:hypothetical protein BOO69_00755 [Sulfitobacter alexandrii]
MTVTRAVVVTTMMQKPIQRTASSTSVISWNFGAMFVRNSAKLRCVRKRTLKAHPNQAITMNSSGGIVVDQATWPCHAAGIHQISEANRWITPTKMISAMTI